MSKKRRHTMKYVFRLKFMLALLVGVIATMLGSSHFLSVFAKDAAYAKIAYSLDYVCNKITDNENTNGRLTTEMQIRMVENAYALQKLLVANPDIINDYELLETFCREQGLTEIYISDANGVVVASVPQDYVGNDYHDYPELKNYLEILEHPQLVIIENLRENLGNPGNTSKQQYAGITRLDQPGIIEVAKGNSEYEEYMETTAVSNIGMDYHIGNEGFLIICRDGVIISASDSNMNGLQEEDCTFLQTNSNQYKTHYQGAGYLAVKRSFNEYNVYGFLPRKETYTNVFLVLICLLICDSLIFVLVYAATMQVINRNVIHGIHQINDSLKKITEGDLECEVNMDNNEELHILSGGINQMVMSLRDALQVRENRISLVTKEKDEISKKAEHDALTGLYNREKINILTDQFMAEDYYVEKCKAAFIMIDHDNFKGVNDNFGHDCGDFVLQRTASLLLDYFGKDSYCARLGGDEFCVFVKDEEPGKHFESRVKKFQNEFEQPFNYASKKMAVTCSIGVSFYPCQGKERTALYKKADVALYEAKEAGRNCYRVYSD